MVTNRQAEPPPGPLGGFVGYLPAPLRRELLSTGHERAFGAGSYLVLQGDPSAYVLVLVSGRVKVVFESPQRERLLLALRGPGDVIGDLSAVGGEDVRRSATVEAMEPVSARMLGAEEFNSFLRRHSEAGFALLRDVRDRLLNAERLRVEAVNFDTMARVTRQLAQLAERYGSPGSDGSVQLRVSQQELAGWVGASRESVGRAMRSLRNRGYVSTRYRTILVMDLAALRDAAGLG